MSAVHSTEKKVPSRNGGHRGKTGEIAKKHMKIAKFSPKIARFTQK
jgi:hypothetical protein